MTRGVGVRLLDDRLERLNRRAEIADTGMDDTRLAPQRHHRRRKHQHSFNNAQRILGPAGTFVARFDVVLQTHKDVAIADRGVMVGRQFGFHPRRCFEKFAQINGRAFNSFIERIDDQPCAVFTGTYHKMAREVDPVSGEAMGPGSMQIQNAQRHRQPFFSIYDAHQIGILNIVIGEHIAVIAMRLEDDAVQCLDQRDTAGGKGFADIIGKTRYMVAVPVKRDTRAVERGKRKRAFGEIDFAVGAGPDVPKDFLCLCAWCHDAGITIPGGVKGLKAVA